MRSVDTVIIGAGQAGLAMSRCLTDRGREHVVLERGRLAERWRSERWASMRLLSPNWMTRLPGWAYSGPDPDGFMTAGEVVSYFEGYATASAAPVEEQTAVSAVTAGGRGFRVATSGGEWSATNVVVATGWCDLPAVPSMARALPAAVHQIAPRDYRDPSNLPDGGVLVVGASATGVQIAAELRAAGRDVVVAVGRHTRLPRRHRGMDVLWWLERMGRLDRTIDEVTDPRRAWQQPSLQLTGHLAGRACDLPSLHAAGVRLAGHLTGIDGVRLAFADDLSSTTGDADRRMFRLLGDIDRHIAVDGLAGEVLDDPAPVRFTAPPSPTELDLRRHGIRTVVWATGHRRAYPWLHLPVIDADGELRQRRGVTSWPGLYVLGLRFQHFRSSDFIDGVGRDAAAVAEHLVGHRQRGRGPSATRRWPRAAHTTTTEACA